MESIIEEGPILNETPDFYEDPTTDNNCARCGECCTGNFPLMRMDILRIKYSTGLEEGDFMATHYSRPEKRIRTIKNEDGKYYCIFFKIMDDDKNSCDLHENGVKPFTCMFYPFNLECVGGTIKNNIKGYLNRATFYLLCTIDLFIP